jgi:fatty acid desaturase
MVGKIVGAAAFLSVIVLFWLLIWRAEWSPLAMAGGIVVFLFIGGFATLDATEWRKKGSGR